MTISNLLSAALIGAAMIATPAMARESGVASPRMTSDAYASGTRTTRYSEGQAGVRAPDVGAFASEPYVIAPLRTHDGLSTPPRRGSAVGSLRSNHRVAADTRPREQLRNVEPGNDSMLRQPAY